MDVASENRDSSIPTTARSKTSKVEEPPEIVERRAREAARKREKRKNETSEARAKRLAKEAARKAAQRAAESPEQRAARLSRESQQRKARLAKETPEQRRLRLEKRSKRRAELRAAKDEEVKQKKSKKRKLEDELDSLGKKMKLKEESRDTSQGKRSPSLHNSVGDGSKSATLPVKSKCDLDENKQLLDQLKSQQVELISVSPELAELTPFGDEECDPLLSDSDDDRLSIDQSKCEGWRDDEHTSEQSNATEQTECPKSNANLNLGNSTDQSVNSPQSAVSPDEDKAQKTTQPSETTEEETSEQRKSVDERKGKRLLGTPQQKRLRIEQVAKRLSTLCEGQTQTPSSGVVEKLNLAM